VRLLPPNYVKPYVKRQKNDATHAEANCEAVTRAQWLTSSLLERTLGPPALPSRLMVILFRRIPAYLHDREASLPVHSFTPPAVVA
jgi:transposase